MHQAKWLMSDWKYDRGTHVIWPSSGHHLSYSRHWLDRRAFLVVNEATKPKNCVRCLILRTELFCCYVFQGDRLGYVWMRQTSGDLFKACIPENSCTDLWNDETAEQFTISDDTRPWSVVALGAWTTTGITSQLHEPNLVQCCFCSELGWYLSA